MSFFHLITIISKLSMLWHTAVIHLIFLMHNIPFCDCRKIYLFTIIFLFIYRIHLFKAFMVFQSFFLRGERFPGGTGGKNLPVSARDIGSIVGSGWSPGVIQLLSHVWLFVTPRSAAHRASLSTSHSQSGNSWSSNWHPTPVLLPGESHGWRSLVGCSPWGLEE